VVFFLIVGKAPIEGFAKTRLANQIGSKETCRIYQAMLHDFFSRMAQGEQKLPLFFFITPWSAESVSYFTNLLLEVGIKNYVLRQQPQTEGLFFRLKEIYANLNKEIASPFFTHLTGTDIPHFPFNEIPAAREANQVTIGPDLDGGFYYLGCWNNHIDILKPQGLIESNTGVLETIYERIDQKGLSKTVMNKMNDIDDLNDLNDFCQTAKGNYKTKVIAHECIGKNLPFKTK
jgi:glycosyltransferase A (GT-A) superfamily protein (DUF2064 family)